MEPVVESKREAIAEICRRFHVKRLEVFGSAARGDFDPRTSDVDLLVEFEKDRPGSALGTFFGFKEALEELFGRSVDLVEEGAIRNPYLRKGIDASRELLYAA